MSEDQKLIAEVGKKLAALESAVKALDLDLLAARAGMKVSRQAEDQKLIAQRRQQIADLERQIQMLDGELTELQAGLKNTLEKLRSDLQVQNGKLRNELRDLETKISDSFKK